MSFVPDWDAVRRERVDRHLMMLHWHPTPHRIASWLSGRSPLPLAPLRLRVACPWCDIMVERPQNVLPEREQFRIGCPKGCGT
eukprot:11351330-Alexandrium_andersonii.AAC.1